MFIEMTFDSDFDSLWMHLKSKHGSDLFDLDGIGKQLDMNRFAKEFFNGNDHQTTADVSVDSNANVDSRDIIAYTYELPKPYFRYSSYYQLWKMLRELYGLNDANRIIEMQLTGDIYINDFGDISRPYCFNYSTFDVALQGLPMVKKIISIAPKYLYSFKSQLEQFIVIASNSTLGATGLADAFIVMSYYIDKMIENGHDAGIYFDGWLSTKNKKDISELIDKLPNRDPMGLNDDEIESITSKIKKICNNRKTPDSKKWFEYNVWKYVSETLGSLIYTINQPMRGNQSPFTNISIFDSPFLESLCDNYQFPDGNKPSLKTVQKVQELFLDIMNRELSRTPVTFPVTTACFSIDEQHNIIDEDFAKMIAEKNQQFGFINIYCGETSTLSSCCRLRSNIKNEYFNSFGAGSSKIGSLGVVTMNLPRLAMKCIHDEKKFFSNLKELIIDVAKINHAKRLIIMDRIEKNGLPLYTLGFMELAKQYSTVGVTGLNECAEILGYNIVEEDGQQFILNCLDVINDTNANMEKTYKTPHNCEQVPAENSAIKLSTKDRYMGYKNDYSYYSNQFIPLTTTADLIDRIHLQGLFDKHFSGGAICHINVEQQIHDANHIVKLIKVCAKKGIVYFAINYNLQRCGRLNANGVNIGNGHMTVGKHDMCPICGDQIIDNFTRVVGFLTNTKNWHKIRRETDYPHRQFYEYGTDKSTDKKFPNIINHEKVISITG